MAPRSCSRYAPTELTLPYPVTATFAPRRFEPALRPTDGNRLAGHDSGDREPMVHAVGVHDPGHGLRRGVHVGCGDVAFRTHHDADLGRIPAGRKFHSLPP